jgi:hypothetical protein
MFGAPERLPPFGARTLSTVITTSVVQYLNEKIAGVDCMMRIHCMDISKQSRNFRPDSDDNVFGAI